MVETCPPVHHAGQQCDGVAAGMAVAEFGERLVDVIDVMEREGTEFHRHHHAMSCAQDVERRRARRTEPERRVGARTHVDKQHAQTLAAEAGGEIDGRGGLAAAALLVGDRYYLLPLSSTLRTRFIRVRPHGCGLWLLRRFWIGGALRVPGVPYTKEKRREERRTRV